jgi:hypothetical protein
MPLILCHDCGREVSSEAVSCLGCGAPIAAAPVRAPVHTIERTSKHLKLQQLLSVTTILVGSGWLVGGGLATWTEALASALVVWAGFLWLWVTKVRMWWHHK